MASLCTAEISLYPLHTEYLDVISNFITALEKIPELSLSVSTTSTQVRGPYKVLFSVLAQEIENVHQQTGQAILVCKFLAGDDVGIGIHPSHAKDD